MCVCNDNSNNSNNNNNDDNLVFNGFRSYVLLPPVHKIRGAGPKCLEPWPQHLIARAQAALFIADHQDPDETLCTTTTTTTTATATNTSIIIIIIIIIIITITRRRLYVFSFYLVASFSPCKAHAQARQLDLPCDPMMLGTPVTAGRGGWEISWLSSPVSFGGAKSVATLNPFKCPGVASLWHFFFVGRILKSPKDSEVLSLAVRTDGSSKVSRTDRHCPHLQ